MSNDSLAPVPECLAHAAARPHWERIGAERRFGVCVPVSALRSNRDCGIGDFGDLPALVDWCAQVGASVIQILPVNDMGVDGTIPYAAISAFALDPLYIALDKVDEIRADKGLMSRLGKLRKHLNALARVDYAQVRREKEALLRQALERHGSQELDSRLAAFQSVNPWLHDYLLYRCLKERHESRSFEEWTHLYPTESRLDRARQELASRIRFHLYEQWLLLRQLRSAREYANSRGVLLKGDIPILVARDSADVWRNQRLFRMDTAAGAPPDMYTQEGQNWGFPTYNWDVLASEDYSWWRSRLRHAAQFFDLYRIDHVVGFFRIWTIPYGRQGGKDGVFVPGDTAVWGEHGARLLTMMLDSCNMLPLAEDLGTIPHVCRSTLRNLGICGLKVQRWEKWWESNRRFIDAEDYPVLSVATLSTHDSDTLAGWWRDTPGERQELFEFLGHNGPAPETLDASTEEELIRFLASCPSLFLILMLQDVLHPVGLLPGNPDDHRINIPGTLLHANWTWRCPATLEALLADGAACNAIRGFSAR